MVLIPLRPNAGRHHPQPKRRVVGCPGEPVTAVVGLDVVHLDRGITELGAAQHRLQPLDQRRVGAPVHAQRPPLAGRPRGLQIGDDVTAAERVDRLLRVADQDHRALSAERPLDHLPLSRSVS